MITKSFHEDSLSLFSPEAFFGEKRFVCDTAISTFSCEIRDAVLDMYTHEEIGHNGSVNGHTPIYLLNIDGKKVIFYMSPICSSAAGNQLIETHWQTGFKKLIIFGSAGALDSNATKGKYVIPTEAYRDEGMSYHYAPASDYIKIKNSEVLASVFEKLGLPYVKGKVWTTDAPYRETKAAVEKRRSDGCIAVEMELAGLQAVCSYYDIELYSFLVTGDVLDGDEYDASGLSRANHSLDKFKIGLEISKLI